MSTTAATSTAAASMPSGYLSNLKLAADDRKRIWDSLTPERQAEAAAKFGTAGTTVKEQKFTSLGEALSYDYSKGQLNSDISVKASALTSENGAKFGSLVNFDSMNSAVFLELKQGTYPAADNPTWITDETTKQKYVDAFNARAYDAYKTAADKFGGFNSQTMLGYDVNNSGYIDNESELFGFGTRGLTMSDFFEITPDGSGSNYKLRDRTNTDSTTTMIDNIAIDPKRFMALNTEGKSASVIGTSYDSGTPGLTTTISLNLLSSSGISTGTTAAISIDVTKS